MNEMPKDPILGTDNTLGDNTQKLAETIQELNSVIADVNSDTFSDMEIPAVSATSEKTVSARPVISQPRPTAAPISQYPYNSSIPQATVPNSAPQYARPAMQQPYSSYPDSTYPQQPMPNMQADMKFCKFCAARIPSDAVICTVCGRQVEQLAQQAQQPVIINNTNTNVNNNNNNNNAVSGSKPRNKWTAFFLCLLLGYLGVHKFYEGRILSGLLYLFTGGLFGIGWLLDTLILLFKPNPYYIK